ncbi:MAG: hypothetical protein ACRDJ1_10075 [Actinomycetota bacterium]
MKVRILVALALMFGALAPADAAGPDAIADGDVYASVSASEVVLGNAVVERRWQRDALVTTALKDKRPGGAALGGAPDFSLLLLGQKLSSDLMTIEDVTLATLPRGGVSVTFSLSLFGLLGLERVTEAYPGVAGFSSRTTVTAAVPFIVGGYTLDEAAAGAGLAPTIHAFRAGADWRFNDDFNPVGIGDKHLGDWRETVSAPAGSALDAPGEWMTLTAGDARTLFMVMERRDYASSRMSYDGTTASAVVDLSRDIIYVGPFEENIHVENPTPLPARHRALIPGRPVELERVFTGFGYDADDEPWQFSKYLLEHRLTPYRKAITFNTNQVDDNAISTGAKDDVDFARFVELAEAAREMGVETFIFDDGWQATSGDWCPDSADCPEPRAPRYPPRFPDATFTAVRDVLAGDPSTTADDMELGLWMNPMEFHPASAAFETNPQWSCIPAGTGTAVVNLLQPDDGSNEAGIGVWNPEALGLHPDDKSPAKLIDYIEERTLRMIEVYGARYFKFDFLVWLDCIGLEPVDMYGYHDSFVAMMDRLQAAHPEVTFQIDETNDYRMFPFESVARGPSWFQNGAPETPMLLHNIWNLAPWVPGFSLGQHALGRGQELASRGVDQLMAAALGSHITFWTEIDQELTPAQRIQVKRWTDFYKANRDTLATFTYPLLAEPLANGWTALQPWNPDAGSGYLLAYRQGAANATQSIPLRGIRGDGAFDLTLVDPANGSETPLGPVSADELRAGIDVTIPDTGGYAIIRITPA